MFARIEFMLERADTGCQLWPHEIAQATQLIVNTLYFLELDFFQRAAAERSREAIISYATSRCVSELHALRHRDEKMRQAAWQGLDDLRRSTLTASLNSRAASLGMSEMNLKCA